MKLSNLGRNKSLKKLLILNKNSFSDDDKGNLLDTKLKTRQQKLFYESHYHDSLNQKLIVHYFHGHYSLLLFNISIFFNCNLKIRV